MLRKLRPDLRIGFTLHSPLPPAESFLALAGRDELLAGLAAADIVSFTDGRSQANFTTIADETGTAYGCTVVMPMPADGNAFAHLAETGAVQAHASRIRARLRPASIVFLSISGHDPGAIVVNPHEPEALGRAMLTAAAQRHSWSPDIKAIREQVLTDGITTWADQFLHTLKPRPYTANGRLQQTWRAVPAARHQEGSRKRGQASDTGGQLTVTASHP
jgi:trehalose-6-phosphate synthase